MIPEIDLTPHQRAHLRTLLRDTPEGHHARLSQDPKTNDIMFAYWLPPHTISLTAWVVPPYEGQPHPMSDRHIEHWPNL